MDAIGADRFKREETPVEEVLEEFVDAYRREGVLAFARCAQRHPHRKAEIRELLPAFLLLDDVSRSGSAVVPRGEGDPTPTKLGDFVIVREVGRGGMGVVYEAVQESLSRHVAVKFLFLHSLLDEARRQNLFREARAAARLQHPNIVPVFSTGEYEGIPYYAMQFIRGRGLDKVLKEVRRIRLGVVSEARSDGDAVSARDIGRGLLLGTLAQTCHRSPGCPRGWQLSAQESLPAPEGSASCIPGGPCEVLDEAPYTETRQPYFRSVARIGFLVADALSHAHAENILHRDIKPSNILLDEKGGVWITDFGLAVVDGGDPSALRADLVGTPRYMAPERLRGESTAAGDVYALGLTLYEALTLRPAFPDGDHGEVVRAILEDEPPPPREIDGRIPADLEAIVLAAAAKDPRRRYASAGELADDLRRYLSGYAPRIRRSGLASKAWRWCLRKPSLAVLGASLAVVLAAVAMGSLRVAAQLREHLWEAHASHARAHRLGERPGRQFESLAALAQAAAIRPTAHLRDEAIAAMALVDVRPEAEVPWPKGALQVVFSPALDSYAAAIDDSDGVDERSGFRDLSVRRVSDGSEVARFRHEGHKTWLIGFGPDGAHLAARYESDSGVSFRVFDVRKGRAVLQGPFSRRPALAFSRDGRWLAAGDGSAMIRVHDLASGSKWKQVRTAAPPFHLDFHPDGSMLAVSGDGTGSDGAGIVQVLDLRTGTETARLRHPDAAASVCWDPAGEAIAVACMNGKVYLWDPADPGEPRQTLAGHDAQAIHLAFDASGELLASAGWDATTRVWDPWGGRLLLTLSPTDTIPRFGSSSWRLATGSREHGTIHVVAGPDVLTSLRSARPSLVNHCRVAVRDAGGLIASVARDGVCVWDVASASLAAFVPALGARDTIFHPRGDTLVTCGPMGIHAWPLGAARGGGLEVGPSRAILSGLACECLAVAEDRRILAAVGSGSLRILDIDSGKPIRSIDVPPTDDFVTLSPGADFAATSGWQKNRVRVWSLSTGRIAATLPGLAPKQKFSPDGKWLAVATGKDASFWRVGIWEPGPRIPREVDLGAGAPLAFSRDGAIFAFADGPGLVRLLSTESFQEVARLEVPGRKRVRCLGLDGGDGHLAVLVEPHTVKVWELRRVRERLATMGLDWELPRASASPHRAEDPASDRGLARRGGCRRGREVVNPRFLGCAGATEGAVRGSAPDGWRVFAEGSTMDVASLPVPAGALFEDSPACHAMRLRSLAGVGRHGLDNRGLRLAVVPGRRYRARFFARGEAGAELRTSWVFCRGGPGSEAQEIGVAEQVTATGDSWREVSADVTVPGNVGSVYLRWECVPPAPEAAVLVALPTVEDLIFPDGLSCRVEGARAALSWRSHAAYESLRVLRDGVEIARLAPDGTSFEDPAVPPGPHIYRLEAVVLRQAGGAQVQTSSGVTSGSGAAGGARGSR